ncbi:MAG: hypothetical protein AAF957_11895 [Planctomycetota bacterium]
MLQFNRLLQGSLAALFLVCASAASAAPQDVFEPNDSCGAASLIPLGTQTNLTAGPDDDYYTVRIEDNSEIVAVALDSTGDPLSIQLLEAGCGTTIATGINAPVRYFDCGGVSRDVVIFVPGIGLTDEPYSLTVASNEVVDDPLEDNDSCSSGALVAIQSFTTPDLVVTACDEDFFVARLQTSGVELQVDVVFSQVRGDVDLELWDLGCNNLLASSTSSTPNESLRYVNNTSPSIPEAVVIRVFMKNGEGNNRYALTACFADTNLPSVGVQSCAGLVNSTGRPGTLCARGSDFATDNNLLLYAVDIPSGSAGYFITSPAAGFTANPAGSLGNLCLDLPGRYSFAPQFTGTANAVFYQPDLANTPVAGGGFAPVNAGTRQFWQYWYRDSVGGVAVSNFSSALCVDFR